MAGPAYDFTATENPETLVVYGLVSDPSAVLQQLGTEETRSSLSNRYAIFSPSTPPLRLNSPGWIDLTASDVADAVRPGQIFDICREKITNRASPFSLPLRGFLDLYFRFVDTQIDSHRPDLDARDALFTAEDWRLSAWLPLPQARVFLPPSSGEADPIFAELDLVFWLAESLIGVTIEGGATPIGSKKRRLDFLEAHHPQVHLIRLPKSCLEEGMFPLDLFPGGFADFCADQLLPTGPYLPPALVEPLSEPDA